MKNLPRLVFSALALVAALVAGGCSAESKRQGQLERAATHRRAGDFERARIEYQNVLQKFPDDITAIEGLAIIWRDRGATMREFALLAKLAPLAPGNLEARIRRAQLFALLGSPADARREALAAVSRSASAAEALVVLAETARDVAERKETDDLLKNFPEKNNVWHSLAVSRFAWLRGDREAARQAAARAVAIDPKSAAARAAMGELQAQLGNAEQAAAEFKLVAELAPARSRYRIQHANYLVQSGQLPAAVEALNAIVKETPDNQAALRALATAAMLDKRPADALAVLDKVFGLDAADYEALILRARIWHAQGDAAKAVAEFQRIGTQFPGLGLELPNLALAQLQQNDLPGATTTLEQANARFPDNHEISILLAQLHLRAGQHDRVVAAMTRLLGRRGDLVQPYLLLIDSAKATGKLDALADLFRQNIASNPSVSLLHHMLGLTLRQQNKPAEARTSL
ncbi:MAG: tetratricopeptide repeat protein, partial [Opitutaceae bacterium]|nr:tetratricopeptide repeat protein [Opitutaceae bacterium]